MAPPRTHTTLLSRVERDVIAFGRKIRRLDLADLVIDLYDSALQESSHKTYGTGQRAYVKFMNEINLPGMMWPFSQSTLRATELTLAFFMAFLMMRPTITKASTILSYETHLKWWYRKEGCPSWEYNTGFIKQVRRGLRKTLPSPKDNRSAFLLPMFIVMPVFLSTESRKSSLLRCVTILGFVGMLRPHTFAQIGPDSVQLVIKDYSSPRHASLVPANEARLFAHALSQHQAQITVLGFILDFKSKTQLEARAYFPNLSYPRCHYRNMCPVEALRCVVMRGYWKRGFLKTHGTSTMLTSYLKVLAGDNVGLSSYGLRIGGRTWYLSQGLERQFVDYLGTWASPEASARYYRAAPAAVVKRVQKFYADLPAPDDLF